LTALDCRPGGCIHPGALQFIRANRSLIARLSRLVGRLPRVHSIDTATTPRKETTMTTITRTWMQRSLSIALSAFVTLSVLGGIEALSQRDMAPDSLMAKATQQAAQRS
jgi:hypothetical protein